MKLEFQEKIVPGDGNCLFHCFAGHLNAIHFAERTDWTQQEIRNILYEYYDKWDESVFNGYTDGKTKQAVSIQSNNFAW